MIVLEDIAVNYGEKAVLDRLNITFESGRLHVITGPSGCGKTTLLRTIAGLVRPERGNVRYNNITIRKPIREIFMMHQNYTNFLWKTCLDNVLFPIKLQTKVTERHREEALTLLDKVGLLEYACKYPYELSGGMKQRLALARTLMSKPPVVLMDEPLSALDPATRKAMQDLVLDMHSATGNTIIMVTHDLEEADKMGENRICFKGA